MRAPLLLLFLAAALTLTDLAHADGRIDRLQRAVDRGVANGTLTTKTCESDDVPSEKLTLTVDRRGNVRRFSSGYGSDDSVLEDTTYYDRRGRPRLVVRSAGAVNGTALDERHYFRVSGKRKKRTEKNTGVGYTFPEVRLETKPAEVFKRVCAEIAAGR